MELVADVKIYRPGDPEFAALAATVTPLERIRSHCLADGNGVFAELEVKKVYRRKEDLD